MWFVPWSVVFLTVEFLIVFLDSAVIPPVL